MLHRRASDIDLMTVKKYLRVDCDIAQGSFTFWCDTFQAIGRDSRFNQGVSCISSNRPTLLLQVSEQPPANLD